MTATLAIAAGAAAGARDVTVTNPGGGSVTLTGGFTVTSASAATLSLAYNGKLRDRVGQGNTALGADGALDGTLTATRSEERRVGKEGRWRGSRERGEMESAEASM